MLSFSWGCLQDKNQICIRVWGCWETDENRSWCQYGSRSLYLLFNPRNIHLFMDTTTFRGSTAIIHIYAKSNVFFFFASLLSRCIIIKRKKKDWLTVCRGVAHCIWYTTGNKIINQIGMLHTFFVISLRFWFFPFPAYILYIWKNTCHQRDVCGINKYGWFASL